MKQKQKQIVYDIVRKYAPIRTERVKIEAMYKGVSCADRYLRWLKKDGLIRSYKVEGDSTVTWTLGKEKTTKPQDIFNIKPIERKESILGINK